MIDVELRHLATMVAIVEEGTFGRAGTRLGYTQSTISQQIAALEKSVGGPVFERPGGPRPVRITPLGAVVLDQGRELLAKAGALSDAVERFKAGDGRIDIGTFQSVSNVILPSVVRRLRDEHPGCEIRLYEVPVDPQIGDLDLLFYDRPVDGDVERVKLVDDPYLLVARPGDLPDGPVPLKRLDGSPMVGCHATCDEVWMGQALADAGARPRIVFRSPGNEAILSMVRAGLGWAVLPWLALHGSDVRSDDRLTIHELRPTPSRGIYLHWRATSSPSPLAVRAMELAAEVAAKVSADLTMQPQPDTPDHR
ncbi:LysR family transcriptional regulator [Actinomadura rudentiformis]|uniref:LysR family transcriptional regulator n=1 Tax=Actinomadura rudentiformis TaxID=359158 RepID=A0A6H9Z2N6_9ACTN|nr:LysR family transcriptional regulator [Actinomadura rudentiformis]KAB2352302.1 LysR family transcriptional regulator [Actinomadura rudentiformis]